MEVETTADSQGLMSKGTLLIWNCGRRISWRNSTRKSLHRGSLLHLQNANHTFLTTAPTQRHHPDFLPALTSISFLICHLSFLRRTLLERQQYITLQLGCWCDSNSQPSRTVRQRQRFHRALVPRSVGHARLRPPHPSVTAFFEPSENAQ